MSSESKKDPPDPLELEEITAHARASTKEFADTVDVLVKNLRFLLARFGSKDLVDPETGDRVEYKPSDITAYVAIAYITAELKCLMVDHGHDMDYPGQVDKMVLTASIHGTDVSKLLRESGEALIDQVVGHVTREASSEEEETKEPSKEPQALIAGYATQRKADKEKPN